MIVIVADEFADMIMQVGKQAEELITRLAQKSRAAGIHLMLATQRPSVDVITGLIKANIPVRAALRVNSKVDSRTILDSGGAEDMLGNGDMLFLGPGKLSQIVCMVPMSAMKRSTVFVMRGANAVRLIILTTWQVTLNCLVLVAVVVRRMHLVRTTTFITMLWPLLWRRGKFLLLVSSVNLASAITVPHVS